MRLRKKKKRKEPIKLDISEQIAHAICALELNVIYSHQIQGCIRDWICQNYKQVNPETIQRVFRRMVNDPEHVIEKKKSGRFIEYRVKKLFDLEFDKKQLDLF